uniref:PROTEIN (SUPEROXIDE DISMUTASE) n=1 Tax=Sulfolobus acidocaldarius (strain ATCC 33909 / DSM 639 / JCM 8929 / NBRC 15157 / NCIMB 11770) TaxID=330779 RepID=UPI00001106FE|nr:Chain A, PROTEIN (SUPEROXIDE DISMUTASE) [Sulfolobus acidocaldarius DSM 639]1B06_B Chain B, PROTEIN (SUPEROXIDE DISMUTASE) [Sulfolobus acidocaldarius DSM 639]1B06_C Chain C, PROTEIN (SUPEROXIDE DISMUTASE) [Sulfolobus acidocaldarius DSM 639]1B06_D Chain D, PROTEIN (SUPEROXIDE DISMUTASE) [Sulfolobus acidocaldarius DSM 639]1B06_E Chain E, PROTEIN (SUPEROXIDE DISMUTASE) [Sulfolobus acidocaldarius DSM 639]1B06_F Chain F, PROTEIN (SUPEROXIDE DISMUTASE) [Sulfolobus acidocaldarius DSM 639]
TQVIQLKRYEFPQLPYKVDALEPYISKDIIDVHYNGHHKGYVNGANSLLDRLEKLIKGDLPQGQYDLQGILRGLTFNINGHKLHAIYWNNMAPAGKGGGKPGGALADLIDKQYGSFDRFKQVFSESANSLPGSGWTVLYYDNESGNLQIMTVENHFMNHIAELPVILIVDEFEHAYYLQYKNKRGDYLNAWWNVVNWDDAEKRLQKYLNK